MTDPLDDLLDQIDEVLGETEDDPFPWTDSMTWYPDEFRDPTTGRVYLDQAGWVV